MKPNLNLISRLSLGLVGLCAPCTSSQAGGPFGFADPSFNTPRFTARVYPSYCVADGRGGLLWSFVNRFPDNFAGANGLRVGGLVRTTADGVIDEDFVVGLALQESMGTTVQADGSILVGGRLVGDLGTDGTPDYRGFRLLTNGAIDCTY